MNFQYRGRFAAKAPTRGSYTLGKCHVAGCECDFYLKRSKRFKEFNHYDDDR